MEETVRRSDHSSFTRFQQALNCECLIRSLKRLSKNLQFFIAITKKNNDSVGHTMFFFSYILNKTSAGVSNHKSLTPFDLVVLYSLSWVLFAQKKIDTAAYDWQWAERAQDGRSSAPKMKRELAAHLISRLFL